MGNQNEILDWDSVLESDGSEFTVLPEGDYPFEVTNLERGNFPGSEKMCACNKAAITGVVNVIGLDHYKGSAQATFLIAKAQVTEKKDNVIKAADLTVKGTGKAQKVFVKATALGGARLSYKSDRAGAGITGNGTLTIPATFAGKITVMVNAAETAEYKGASKKVSVIVLPKSMQLSKVKASGSRKAKVTWKKNETAQGYELQCATNKSFTKNVKTLTVTKQNTKKKIVKKLKGGKKYYFRIRAFITINGTKYYSDWSKAKKAKIKK